MPEVPLTRLNLLTLTLLIAALWLATRPYPGIYNDARFYTFEALNALHPGRYAEDLYFKYGSQDQFTIFTRLFAPLVGAIGMSAANILGLLFCQFVFVTGLFYLATGFIADRRAAILAAACVIILPFHIGFIDTGEPFLTPRLPADALCLWALGAMLRHRPVSGVILLSIAMPIHPLLALGAFGVFFIYQAWGHPLWWAASLTAILLACGLAIAGIQPFSRLFVSFDPAWLAVVNIRDSFCLVANWGFYIWLPIVATTALGLCSAVYASKIQQRLMIATFITGAGGILTSYVGGDLFKNVLILDAQLWRAFWPFAVIAYFMLPKLYRQTTARGPIFFFGGRFFLTQTICLLIIAQFFTSIWLVAGPMAVIAAFIIMFEHKTNRQIPAIAGVLALALAISLDALALFGLYLAFTTTGFRPLPIFMQAAVCIVSLVLLFATLQPVKSAKPIQNPTLLLAGASFMLLISLTQWDTRTAWDKYVETTPIPPPSLTGLLTNQPVYWENGAAFMWFVLQRPDYVSCEQGTGVLFSRATALAYQNRLNSIAMLQTQDFSNPEICPPAPNAAQHLVTITSLAAVCQKQPGLGAMVLLHDIQGAPHKTWTAPAFFDYVDAFQTPPKLVKTNRFYIYTCADLK